MFWLCFLYIPLSLWVGLGSSQQSGWAPKQTNATMCQWKAPRAAVIRDTVYIDGGYLWWQAGMSDGSYGSVTQDGNPLGLVYLLNFSTPFNTTQNMSQVFTTISAAPAGGAANNLHRLYYDGTMFANDGEYYAYGGLVLKTDAYSPPPATEVQGYEAYWYGAPKDSFTKGFIDGTLPDGITRYLAYGAGVSIPSENKGYYFSGLKSPTSGPIFYSGTNESINANTISPTLISVDLSAQRREKWTNQSLPSTVPGRAGAELVWVPVGKSGVLIAIGGVMNPVYAHANKSLDDSQSAQDQVEDPKFMRTVSVYDIESGSWFSQETSGEPPTGLAQGCTVVASAQDYSSHNIYWYGGFDGIDLSTPFSDDVYVLSVPSFMWKKVYSGTNTHGRAGHRCVKPYPDQMFVIGGYPAFTSSSLTCLENNIVQVFNLSSATWMTSYDPTVWSNYSVPPVIVQMIGGTGAGGAIQLGPSSPVAWSNKTLQNVFSTTYDAAKIKNWYPYALAPTNTTTPPIVPSAVPAPSSGLPSWVAPVLGTVLGLVGVSAIVVCIVVWRRRRYFQRSGTLTETSDMNRYRIMNWVRSANGKAPTVTSEGMPSSPSDDTESTVGGNGQPVVEAAGNEVHELMDTSRPQELSDTGMSYLSGTGIAALRQSPSSASHGSYVSQTSSVSRSSSPQIVSPHTPHQDSPSIGSPSLGSPPGSRVVSGITEAGSAHIRQLSLDSEISEASTPQGLGISRHEQQIPVIVTPESEKASDPLNRMLSPVSPPIPNFRDGPDYITGSPSARTGSGLTTTIDSDREGAKVKRRSNFGEMLDEE